MATWHLLEVHKTFKAECGDERTGRTTMEKIEEGTRLEAKVRPLETADDLIERCDIQLPEGLTYLNVPYKHFIFVDREAGAPGLNGQDA
jgi:hypothetical protein